MARPAKKHIKFAGHDIDLYSNAALHLTEYNVLVISDINLEKPNDFMTPSFCSFDEKTQDTLSLLEGFANEIKPEKIIILGDIFHDSQAFERMSLPNMDRLYRFFREYKIVWVEGHHNDAFSPPGADLRIEYAYLNLNFRHIASDKEDFEISGNYNPCYQNVPGAQNLSRCFITDKTKLVVPSFNCNARAININEPVIQTLFSGRQRVFPLDNNQIQALSHHG